MPRLPATHYFVLDLTVDELEEIVKDKVLAACCIARELEGLRVVHRTLLLVDLLKKIALAMVPLDSRHSVNHTRSWPVTRMTIPPSTMVGWASRVETWCLTF